MAEAYWTYCMYCRGMVCGVEILEDNDDVVILYAHRQCHRQTPILTPSFNGWRKGEITRFEWRDVLDTVIRLRPEVSKNKDGCIWPSLVRLVKLFNADTLSEIRLLPTYFIATAGKVKDFRKAWRTACRKADIPIRDLQLGVKDSRVFHDLQRTTRSEPQSCRGAGSHRDGADGS